MSDAYSSVGYGATKIEFGNRAAVLVVDLQLAFTDPTYALGGLPMIHAATERTGALLKLARKRGLPVAKCYTAYESEQDSPLWKLPTVRKEFLYGHPCTALDARVHDPSYDFTFCKTGPSIFFNTPLVTFLVKNQVDTVIVTGCTTSGCVRASIVDAFSWGYRVFVPEECCGDAEEGPHREALRDCDRRYAEVMKTSELEKLL